MKNYILFLYLCVAALLTSCFDDNSTVATEANRVKTIQVEGLKDTSMVAYSRPLELTAHVEGSSDDELSYAWYIYGGQYEGKTKDGYRSIQIGTGKTLSYPIELRIGYYTVVCEATHISTGYFASAQFRLNVTSDFSQGFYILKETTDGNSELDFYNHLKKEINNDLLTKVHDSPLPGKPRNMNTVYSKVCMDPETATSTYVTGIFVTCGDNNVALYNTTDMSLMFDRSNLHYGEMEADEVPYAMATFNTNNFYFSSKGLTIESVGGDMTSEFATGQTPLPEGEGASPFIQVCNSSSMSYWSESEHCLMRVIAEWSGTSYRKIDYIEDYTGPKIPWEQAKPVATGWNSISGENTIWYLFDVAGEGRYLVFLNGREIFEVRLLNPSLHITQADLIAGRGKETNVIYSVHDNQLYRYSVTEGTEVALSVEALPTGTITWISNLFFTNEKWDYIVIGVQNGDKYTVAMYNIQGGQPYGKPVYTFEGTGYLKKVCYAVPLPQNMYPNQGAFSRWGTAPDFLY